MRKYLILAALSVVASQPVLAQSGAQPVRNTYPGRESASAAQLIDRLAEQIDRDARKGIISRDDAQWLRAEIIALRRLENRYGRYALRTREHSDLLRRIDALRHRVLAAEQQRLARSMNIRRANPVYRENPLFEDVRRGHHVYTQREAVSGRADSRSDDYWRYRDRGSDEDMNDLRGPAPPKRDEGS